MHLDIPERFNAAVHFVDRNLQAGRGDKIAVWHEGRAHTYREIASQVNRWGNALRALDLEAEQRIALLCLDSPEFIAGFFGAIRVGMVPVPLNTLLRPSDYEYMPQDSRARALLVHRELWEPLRPVRERCRHLRHVIVIGGDPDGCLEYDELTRQAGEPCEPADTSRDDVAFWLYSSGSTGFPKGTVHLQHDMVCCAASMGQGVLALSQGDITFSAAKLFFAYGLGNNLYFPFSVGASAVLYPGRPLPEAIFEVIRRHRPTVFYAVPTLYGTMLHLAERKAEGEGTRAVRGLMQSVRCCVSAGEPLPPAIFHRWQKLFGLEILDGIGSTEMLQTFISNRPGRARPGSSGEVVPGYAARIVDEEGRDAPPGAVGDLLVKGDSAAAFYWNRHRQSKQAFLGEWVRTGDRYSRDTDGYFWYAGRSDDMLKVGGIWVSPIEVENALLGHPAVLECAVVGARDRDEMVKPKAFVVLKDGIQPTAEFARELQGFAKEAIAPFKYPRWIEFVSELPKTATGKIQRFRLRG
ncbi:MAG: benzoate-CoA ligase family protein [candidate division NC10 bacterium]|nr:benzoate-CoA ligase family protein [candidate division NC10 bacterium]